MDEPTKKAIPSLFNNLLATKVKAMHEDAIEKTKITPALAHSIVLDSWNISSYESINAQEQESTTFRGEAFKGEKAPPTTQTCLPDPIDWSAKFPEVRKQKLEIAFPQGNWAGWTERRTRAHPEMLAAAGAKQGYYNFYLAAEYYRSKMEAQPWWDETRYMNTLGKNLLPEFKEQYQHYFIS